MRQRVMEQAFTITFSMEGRLSMIVPAIADLLTSTVSIEEIMSRNSLEYFRSSFVGKEKRPSANAAVSILPSTDSNGVE